MQDGVDWNAEGGDHEHKVYIERLKPGRRDLSNERPNEQASGRNRGDKIQQPERIPPDCERPRRRVTLRQEICQPECQ